jgi:hypothetical protein
MVISLKLQAARGSTPAEAVDWGMGYTLSAARLKI